MTDEYPTEDLLPPPPKIDISKYKIDSDADSDDPDAYRQTAPIAGPITDAAAEEEEEEAERQRKAQEEADAAAAAAAAAAAQEAAEYPTEDPAPRQQTMSYEGPSVTLDPSAKPHTGDTDSDAPSTTTEAERVDGGGENENEAENGEEPAALPTVITTDRAVERPAAAPAAAERTPSAPPANSAAVEAQPEPKKSAKKRATSAAAERQDKKKTKKSTSAAEAAAPAEKKKKKKKSAKTNKSRSVSPAKAADDEYPTEDPAPVAQGKPKKTKKKAAAASKASKAAPEGESEGEAVVTPVVDDPLRAKASRSHARKRQAKADKLVATYSSTAGSSSQADADKKKKKKSTRARAFEDSSDEEGENAQQRGPAYNPFANYGPVGTENIPLVIRRSRGGAGGLHAVGTNVMIVNAPDSYTNSGTNAARGARGAEKAEPRDGASRRRSTVNEPPQHRVYVTNASHQRARASEPLLLPTSQYTSVSRSADPDVDAVDARLMQGYLRAVENEIVVNNGGDSSTVVDMKNLPALPPSLVATLVARYETCLLNLPPSELERVVNCMCPAEKDRKPVMAYLREKQKIHQRQQQRHRNTNAAYEAQRQQAFAAGASDASMRGLGVSSALSASGRGGDDDASSSMAALSKYDREPAVIRFKSHFTQFTCAAFLEDNITTCVGRRERYYLNQPALVRAKRIVVEESTLKPVYTQSVNSHLYQTLGLTEAESAQRKFTEPVVAAVMERMPPITYPDDESTETKAKGGAAAKEEDDGVVGVPTATQSRSAGHGDVPVTYYPGVTPAGEAPAANGEYPVEDPAPQPAAEGKEEEEEEGGYVPYNGDADDEVKSEEHPAEGTDADKAAAAEEEEGETTEDAVQDREAPAAEEDVKEDDMDEL